MHDKNLISGDEGCRILFLDALKVFVHIFFLVLALFIVFITKVIRLLLNDIWYSIIDIPHSIEKNSHQNDI